MLNVWERKILRKIYGPFIDSGISRVRRSELSDLVSEVDLVVEVKKRRLQ